MKNYIRIALGTFVAVGLSATAAVADAVCDCYGNCSGIWCIIEIIFGM